MNDAEIRAKSFIFPSFFQPNMSKEDKEIKQVPNVAKEKEEKEIKPKTRTTSFWCEWPDGRPALIAKLSDLEPLKNQFKYLLNVHTSSIQSFNEKIAEIFHLQQLKDPKDYWVETFEVLPSNSFYQVPTTIQEFVLVLHLTEKRTWRFLSNFPHDDKNQKIENDSIRDHLPFESNRGMIGPIDQNERKSFPKWVETLFKDTDVIHCHNMCAPDLATNTPFKCYPMQNPQKIDPIVTRMKVWRRYNKIEIIKGKYEENQHLVIVGDAGAFDFLFYNTHISRLGNMTANSFEINLLNLPVWENGELMALQTFFGLLASSIFETPTVQSSIDKSLVVASLIGIGIAMFGFLKIIH